MTLGLDDIEVKLPNAMESQLHSIAALHDGKVPLHGRLFAQWLHYVFPRDCPFPHRAGTVSDVPPMQFGDHFIASDTEMEHHATQAVSTLPSANATISSEPIFAHDDWMTQWSQEEELLSLHLQALHAPSSFRISAMGFVLIAVGIIGTACVTLL